MASSDRSGRARILLVVRWPVGGIRTYLRDTYSSHDWSHYEFDIVAPDKEELRLLLEDLRHLRLSYIKVSSECGEAEFFRAVSLAILKGRYDLIHSHGLTATLAAALPAVLRRVPHIATSHDMFNDGHFRGFQGRMKRKMVGAVLSRLDAVHCISEASRDNILSYFPALSRNPGKAVAIRSGIDVSRFDSNVVRNFREELGLSPGDFLVGFLGRFMSLKGFTVLVDAIEILGQQGESPQRPMVLAFGWGGFIREDQAYIRRKGLEDYFQFLPFTPDVAASLRGLDVLVMPSLSETCPLLAMEGLVAGVPVIGTDCPGLAEVLANTPATVIPMRDAAALAEAIRVRMRIPGRDESAEFAKEAKRRFDAENAAVRLAALYENTLLSDPSGLAHNRNR